MIETGPLRLAAVYLAHGGDRRDLQRRCRELGKAAVPQARPCRRRLPESRECRVRPDEQGDTFEKVVATLLDRAFREVGLNQVQVTLAARGTQFGYDIAVQFVDASRRSATWHFECKSHVGGVIPLKEIADKIDQQRRSSQDIAVWCLITSHSEPSNEALESVAAIDKSRATPFAIALLTPTRVGISKLLSLYPDLFRLLYGGDPETVDRNEVLQALRTWIESQTERGRSFSAPVGWERVGQQFTHLVVENRVEERAYLNGSSAFCPWEAVIWATPRPTAEEGLARAVLSGRPGFAGKWLVAAGGEGKSTTLRRVAWNVASTGAAVLFADAGAGGTDVSPPLAWIDSRPRGQLVLLCVDGSTLLSDTTALFRNLPRWREEGRPVALLIADRGHAYRRHRHRHGGGRIERVDLEPLSREERRGVAERLETVGLLASIHVDQAADMLERPADSGNRPWLVPTIISLTDPKGRPFEAILQDFLLDLLAQAGEEPLELLQAVSLAHAAGAGLPRWCASRLVSNFATAVDALGAELDREFGPTVSRLRPGEKLFAHGQVVAEALTRISASVGPLRGHFLRVCALLPRTAEGDYSPHLLLPRDRFELLDSVVQYVDGMMQDYEAAAELLASWFAVDSTAFPALHRLGVVYHHWLMQTADQLAESAPSPAQLFEYARAAFVAALEVIDRVLSSEERPRPYASYSQLEQRAFVFSGLTVLYASVERFPKLEGLTPQPQKLALYYALLALVDTRPGSIGGELGLAARIAWNLGDYQLCAALVRVGLWVGTSKASVRLRDALEERGVALPEGAIGDVVVEAFGRAREHLVGVNLPDDQEKAEELLTEVRAALTLRFGHPRFSSQASV